MNKYIKSPLNYTGGKHRLLPQIMPLLPHKIDTFVDIFCGGANVGINVHANNVIYNDKCDYLINLYKIFDKYSTSELLRKIENIIKTYCLSNSFVHGYDYYGCNSADGLSKYNRDRYTQLKSKFNSRKKKDDGYYLLLYVLIIYSFNNQIRFNSKGEFNLPVGKRDFNSKIRKNFCNFVNKIKNQQKQFMSQDFRKIDISMLTINDCVYCDPPYMISTASYNEQNGWTPKDELDLLQFLDSLNKQGVKFALSNVTHHKGNVNKLLIDWSQNYVVHELNFTYENSSYHGNNTDKQTREVLITNY